MNDNDNIVNTEKPFIVFSLSNVFKTITLPLILIITIKEIIGLLIEFPLSDTLTANQFRNLYPHDERQTFIESIARNRYISIDSPD